MKNKDFRKKFHILTEELTEQNREISEEAGEAKNAELIRRYFRPSDSVRPKTPVGLRRRVFAAALCACLAVVLGLAVILPFALKSEDVYLNTDDCLSGLTTEELSLRSGRLLVFPPQADGYVFSSSILYFDGKEENTICFFVDYEGENGKTLRVFFVEDMRYFDQIPGYKLYENGFDGTMTVSGAELMTKSINSLFVAKTFFRDRLVAFRFGDEDQARAGAIIGQFLAPLGDSK